MEDAPVNKSSLIDYDDKMSKLFVSKLIKNGRLKNSVEK